MYKIFKFLSYIGFVSKIGLLSKSLSELLNFKLIFLLIIGCIVANSLFLAETNITPSFDVEVEKETDAQPNFNDRCISKFAIKHHIFFFNKMYTNEWYRKEKNELIKKQHDLNYNQIQLILAGINSSLPEAEEEKRSDLFYYILGILILIISAFILRQRYKQYLEEKNKFNQ